MHPGLADQCNTVGAEVADSNMVMVPDSIRDQGAASIVTTITTQPPTTTYLESPPDSSHNMADQCIVCLEDLINASDPIVHDVPNGKEVALSASNFPTTQPGTSNGHQNVAVIKPCGHCLHDECLREWTQKANSCPFCRQNFNLVEVMDKVGGNLISEYEVEDRKQVASTDFDPAWIEEEEEVEETAICPICAGSDNEDVLLLCDACNAPYHTYCVGLPTVPNGQWFCMECQDDGTEARALELRDVVPRSRGVRTQGIVRQNRRRIREDHWYGTWSLFSNRVQDVMGLDLDFSDEDDSHMRTYRQLQRRTSSRAREFQQWQQRLNIASRQGARHVFQAAQPPPRHYRHRTPPTPAETTEESKAWGAFERAKELDGAPRNRKRKSRSARTSATASPVEGSSEAPREPERKLKRPRTRRVLEGEASSSSSAIEHPARPPNPISRRTSPPNGPRSSNGAGYRPSPSFLSSLLKEVERSATSVEETTRSAFSGATMNGGNRVTSPSIEHTSPATSPSPSSSHTPRGLSITPPPHLAQRHASPRPMTSHVEPMYPRADYSPNRSPGEFDTESRRPTSPASDIRQPRPQRHKPKPLALARSPDASPVRATMSAEAKDSINRIVKYALGPHWKSHEITKEQYADINRDVSRKLYELVADRDIKADRERWEKVAKNEVASAVQAVRT